MNEKMITVKELQEILRISRQTVMRWRQEGMPHYKHQASVRFELEEVKKWLRERSEENSN